MSSAIDDKIKKWFIPLLGFNILLFLVWSVFLFSWSVDDLLISARYGKNLVEHGVWNWNPTGDKVEAYTTLTYTIIPIFSELFNINPFLILKIFGLFLYGLTIKRLYQFKHSMLWFWLSVTFLNLYFYVFIHIYSGFETYLFAFLLFEIFLLLSGKAKFKETYFYILLILLPLTRPEGALFAMIAFGIAFYQKQVVKKKIALGIVLGLGAVYMVWRIKYFGHLLPNTFYVKSVSDSTFKLKALINIYFDKIIYITVLISLLAVIKNKAVRFLGTASLLILLFLYFPSGLATDVGSRFFFQITFFILLGGFIIVQQLRSKSGFLIICVFLLANSYQGWLGVPFLAKIYPIFHQGHVDIGKRLAKFNDEGYTMAVCEAGAMPYYSGWQSFDLLALADERLARETLTESYLEDNMPDLFLIMAETKSTDRLILTLAPDPKREKEAIFKRFLANHPEYEYIAASKRFFNTYTISIINKNIPHYEEIKKELQENDYYSNNTKISWKKIFKQQYFLQDIKLPE
ncbi:MAG: hypothetical protein R2753_06965 [Chitinophagales bacterium]